MPKVKLIPLGVLLLGCGAVWAQQDQQESEAASQAALEEVVVTGSRIARPGAVSTSPIFTLDSEEISFQQEPELERVLRDLPSTIPGDGQNVNNGTDGAATVDLRALGPQRNLVLMNGRRITPFNYKGRVDTSIIPTALIERVDIITGGASAVYGSDAIAGAVNVILKDDFRGVVLDISHNETFDEDGDVDKITLTLGSDLDDGKGNVVFALSWSERQPLLLGERDLGNAAINTATGTGVGEFLRGESGITPTVEGCTGPSVVDITASGSTTAIPTRLAIASAGSVGQFLNDRSVYTGNNRGGCSKFNFNPFNYYRTPNEKYNVFFSGNYEINEYLDVYANVEYSNVTVRAQIAPSGTFGATFDVPLANPFISDSALTEILEVANNAIIEGTLSPGGAGDNWHDVNGNGVVDLDDYLKLRLQRRTVELGPRSENYDLNHYMIVLGARGDIGWDWEYDLYYQYGESNLATIRDGYTNLTNIQNALDTTDTESCTGQASGDASCVPLDLFGGLGTITSRMAGYITAVAQQRHGYEQRIFNATFNGPVNVAQLPWALSPLLLSVGYEDRREEASLDPDECLKLAPASCQGGAGGNILPISGGVEVQEFILEGYLPIVDNAPFARSLGLEIGWRRSDYDLIGAVNTWKLGLNWQPIDQLLVRVMQQQAIRAPNVEELFAPVTTGLDNATIDPCSKANDEISATLRQLCIDTGMLPAQVGRVEDIVSNQISILQGADPNSTPFEETADTFTLGVVWTPSFSLIPDLTLSLDYYDIDISDTIGEFSAQEILDGCYEAGRSADCARIMRVDGSFAGPSAGVLLYTTNLAWDRVSGIELGYSFGFDLAGGQYGRLDFSGSMNYYLENETLSSSTSDVIDCNGFYGTTCDPTAQFRWVQRASWSRDGLTVSLNLRHLSAVDIEPSEAEEVYSEFQSINAYNYLDLYVSFRTWDERINVSLGIDNLLDEEPPIVGDGAGDTSSNSGGTFPSNYDVIGAAYTIGFKMTLR